jgi:hypothetical protein
MRRITEKLPPPVANLVEEDVDVGVTWERLVPEIRAVAVRLLKNPTTAKWEEVGVLVDGINHRDGQNRLEAAAEEVGLELRPGDGEYGESYGVAPLAPPIFESHGTSAKPKPYNESDSKRFANRLR